MSSGRRERETHVVEQMAVQVTSSSGKVRYEHAAVCSCGWETAHWPGITGHAAALRAGERHLEEQEPS